MRLVALIAAGLAATASPAAAQDELFPPLLPNERWYEAISAAPSVVYNGYSQARWPFKGQLWREVLRCSRPQNLAVDLERTCFVCSMDDVGGLKFGKDTMPPYGIAITAAYARFKRDDTYAWQLTSYEPFGGQHRAPNGEPRHRASVRWVREQAVEECEELQELVGTEAL